ncbi:MAG: sulfite exporter TauE/SafE family protein [Gammaproteobacteria bacterium]|nr:MAG: sulfite exporter TauE/SafE family protein [Gammaproteobacteria bacterium]
MTPIIILTIVCILTYSFEIVFGLAGTIMMLFVMTAWFDAKTLVIYSLMPQILVATIGLLRSPRTVRLDVLAGMVGFASLGGLLGLVLFYRIPTELFQKLLATAIILFGLHMVVGRNRLRLGPFGARVMDTVAGLSQTLFGISGPIAMTRMMASFEGKVVIRNYALAFFLAMNSFRLGGYLVNGTISNEVAWMMLVSAPVLAVALWWANHLHFRINERVFSSVVAWIILLGGITLYF